MRGANNTLARSGTEHNAVGSSSDPAAQKKRRYNTKRKDATVARVSRQIFCAHSYNKEIPSSKQKRNNVHKYYLHVVENLKRFTQRVGLFTLL